MEIFLPFAYCVLFTFAFVLLYALMQQHRQQDRVRDLATFREAWGLVHGHLIANAQRPPDIDGESWKST